MKPNAILALVISLLSTHLAAHSAEKTKTAVPAMQTSRAQWLDNSRQRAIPYKIYWPATKAPAPVIIFSHGLGGSRDGYEYLGKGWAQAGFVSVHLQHAGSDSELWQNKGIQSKSELLRVFGRAATPRNAVDRAKDVSFALDELAKMNRSGTHQNRLDLSRVGMAGHSFGANTTLMVSGLNSARRARSSLLDSRIKAAIPMSSPAPREQADLKSVYSGIKIPMLHMTGTEDTSPIGDDSAQDRLLPYQNITAPHQYLLVFQGGDHMVFSGRRQSEDPKQAAQDKTFQALILQSSTVFWNAYLKNDAKAQNWLRNDFKNALGKNGRWEYR
jgi:predicted dienelactone hydrolase